MDTMRKYGMDNRETVRNGIVNMLQAATKEQQNSL